MSKNVKKKVFLESRMWNRDLHNNVDPESRSWISDLDLEQEHLYQSTVYHTIGTGTYTQQTERQFLTEASSRKEGRFV